MPIHPFQTPPNWYKKVAKPGTTVGNQVRDSFTAAALALCGDVRLLWLPLPTETTTTTDRSRNGATITEVNTMAGRSGVQGSGVSVSYNGTTDYATVPDAANLSFGNGVSDSPVSFVVWANITNTAAARTLIAKDRFTATTRREYVFEVSTTDKFEVFFYDDSASAYIGRLYNTAITQGSVAMFVATYDGSAANSGVRLYQNGVRVDDTDYALGAYTAMENLTEPVSLMARDTSSAAADVCPGTMLCSVIAAKALTIDEIWALKAHGNAYFGLSL